MAGQLPGSAKITVDKMLLIQTDFADDKEMSGYFILVPDEESDEKILHALGF